jgi:altronate dehydratase small subunit
MLPASACVSADMAKAIVLHDDDDVAVLVEPVTAGGTISVVNRPSLIFAAPRDLPLGHKIALRDLPAGHHVRKYGEVIGRATSAVDAGAHVHVHNLVSLRAK